MKSQINELLNEKDNSEKIRDTIAAILLCEIQNQKELAIANNIEDKDDFNIHVFLENLRPWELVKDEKENNPFPLVTVNMGLIQESEKPGSTINNFKYDGQYYIDCYGCGNAIPENMDEGYIPDDYLAALRAWKTARVVRNILMSGIYTYLGIREIVSRRRIISMASIVPPNVSESAITVMAVRIIFEVNFSEKSPQAQPTTLEAVSFTTNDLNGELVSIDNVLKD